MSLFTGRQIPEEYVQSMAQSGRMGSALYAVAVKNHRELSFQAPEQNELDALDEAGMELERLRASWERNNVIPIERILPGAKTGAVKGHGTDLPLKRGQFVWTDMFTPRQLLCFGVLVEELRKLRAEIVKSEGHDLGEAVAHLLAIGMDKFANWRSSWNAPFGGSKRV